MILIFIQSGDMEWDELLTPYCFRRACIGPEENLLNKHQYAESTLTRIKSNVITPRTQHALSMWPNIVVCFAFLLGMAILRCSRRVRLKLSISSSFEERFTSVHFNRLNKIFFFYLIQVFIIYIMKTKLKHKNQNWEPKFSRLWNNEFSIQGVYSTYTFKHRFLSALFTNRKFNKILLMDNYFQIWKSSSFFCVKCTVIIIVGMNEISGHSILEM